MFGIPVRMRDRAGYANTPGRMSRPTEVEDTSPLSLLPGGHPVALAGLRITLAALISRCSVCPQWVQECVRVIRLL